MPIYEIREYESQRGKSPFGDWFDGLKDKRARAKIMVRLDRATLGNFGDHKTLSGSGGVSELREHSGPGYRIYYSIIEDKIVLLLVGSLKRDQSRTVDKAKKYLADYIARKDNE